MSGQQVQAGGDSAEGTGTRRKLRSHTRLGGPEEPVEQVSLGARVRASGEASSSPVTVGGGKFKRGSIIIANFLNLKKFFHFRVL